MKLLSIAFGALVGLASTASPAATFVIVNGDDPGVGFNDPTPVAPVGMNTATTRGGQRLAVLRAATDYWAERLYSAVPIHVFVTHQEGNCTPESSFLVNGFTVNAREGNVAPGWNEEAYIPVALDNARRGFDWTPANAEYQDYDVWLNFNPLIDTGCTGYDGWSYDTDPSAPLPDNLLPLLSRLRQELARGLGQHVFGNPETGARWQQFGISDLMDYFMFDTSYPAPGLTWAELSEAERAVSARNHPRLVWSGANVELAATDWLEPAPVLQLNGTAGGAFEYRQGSRLGLPPPKIGTLGGLVVPGLDATAPTGDGCQTLVNAAQLAGNIALVDRGACTFAVKAMAAQNAGAIAVLVANNVPGERLPGMGGTDPALAIPALGITQAAGAHLRGMPAPRVSIGYDLGTAIGTTNGRVRMTADAEPPSGLSITQFTVETVPRAIPGSAFNMAAPHDGLSFALLRDIGWPIFGLPPNDAPYLSLPATFATVVGQPSTLTELWFGDIDSGGRSLTLEFSVTSGTLLLETDAGVQTLGSGTNSARIDGSRVALQAYLGRGGVRFRSVAGNGANVGLAVTINDNGSISGAAARTTTKTSTISMVTNAAPSASGQMLSTAVGTPMVIQLGGTDPDGDGLAFVPVTQPSHGTLAGRLGRFTYTPNAGFAGSDHFDFIALDGVLASGSAQISIVVSDEVQRIFANGFEAP